MSKLVLYGVFHANLNFSYIPEDLYPQIVHDCYWPLLKIAEELNVPLGFEFSGQTLETINSIDPTFVTRLRESWGKGNCEVVGSGLVQSIMPLIPARVNRENLERGNAVYQRLLGRKPSIAYVNEQVFSGGLASLYRHAGYEALIVNWESSMDGSPDPGLHYGPCTVAAGDGDRLPILWHSIAAYRDFQRYIEGETCLETYMSTLLSHLSEKVERAYPFYSSDWEVFDFKPWRVHPDGFQKESLGEMDRISDLLGILTARPEVEFLSPSTVLSRFPEHPPVEVETSATPLTYKKQDQHSLSRWAVGGRDAIHLNTQCFELYDCIRQAEWHVEQGQLPEEARSQIDDLWRQLCRLWGSDLRTFTTEQKYLGSRNNMGAALQQAKALNNAAHASAGDDRSLWLFNYSQESMDVEPISFTVTANGVGHHNAAAYQLRLESQTVPCQVSSRVVIGSEVSKLTMEAMPAMASSSGATAILEKLHAPPNVDRNIRIDPERHLIETDAVRISLLPNKGGAIKSLEFPGVHSLPLILSGHTDMPRGPQMADSAFSGDITLEDSLGRNITDHQSARLQYPAPDESHEIFVPVRCSVQTQYGAIWKTYKVYLDQPRVDLEIRCQWGDLMANSLRMGRMILNPYAFDATSLAYATVNGGDDVEEFPLAGQYVRQDEPMGGGKTARGCIGATEGWVTLRDSEKGLAFITRPASLYSVPLMHYEESPSRPKSFLAMINYSLAEKDETSHTLWRGHSTWHLSVLGGKSGIIADARRSAAIINGGLSHQSHIEIT